MNESATSSNLFSKPVNINWEVGADAPVNVRGSAAVWLNGLVYMGGGYENEVQGSYTIYCYDPIKNFVDFSNYCPLLFLCYDNTERWLDYCWRTR